MNNRATPVRVVITGGPGAGKTTLLDALRMRGYVVVPEVAREIIADRKARGLAPRPAPAQFARMIIERDIVQYHAIPPTGGIVFFDRSLIDSVGMLTHLGDGDKSRLLARYPYHPTVFILPPWHEIYRTDAERDQSFHESVSVFHRLRDLYVVCGYNLIEVPRDTVDQRCEFVMRKLKAAGL